MVSRNWRRQIVVSVPMTKTSRMFVLCGLEQIIGQNDVVAEKQRSRIDHADALDGLSHSLFTP